MRTNHVAKGKKAQGTCIRCHEPIVAGEAYAWAKGRYSARRVIHAACGSFKPSELTDNDKIQTLYAAQEGAHEALQSLQSHPATADECGDFTEELQSILQDAADQAEEARAMYEESAEAIEEGFGHETYSSEEQREGAQMVETWIDALTSVDFDEFDPEGIEDDDLEGALDDWANDCVAAASDAIDELEV